mmetsp:Transcript_6019/g.17233  ORF Transcript_6019/g.17233 Transcript_6019/m.17233 type:complete len:390 (-) Transcript_6019:378-1547(-)|eukprot:CAMPEP_0206142274 /NCGR_PEP_ID=MMETSP1473-20131121/16218_1 /ASSEMBLY_ACC=CAM_ASM_001109 /TAXON_ID=1461547 /ORGANISM="Stichococcus sp, Strain RCC1054" /LENGTH=389 /DNA_ID=CAMNT_0053537205 /DNA_START=212 /DNA_END=1381 /DNA_ORIENTATION=+
MALLGVPRKRTGRLDIAGALFGWLRANRGAHIHTSPQAEATAAEANSLRDFAFEPLGAADAAQEKLLRYYKFLTALEAALPVGPERRGVPITWSWQEAFSDARVERTSVAFEKAAVLFTAAALLTADAVAADSKTDAGRKLAARRFQEAAAMFSYLAGQVPLKLDFQGMADLSPDTTTLLSAICLAQAQDVTYQKAAADGKSPALLARIALQAHTMYADTRKRLDPDSSPLAKVMGKPLAAHLAAKAALLGALSWRHSAAAAEADDQCGTRLACLQEASLQLAKAKVAATSQKVDTSLTARIAEENAAVAAAAAGAQRENDTVYLQRVPPPDAIERGAPALLVKAAPLPDLEVVEDRWFAFLNTPAPDPPPQQPGGGGLLGAIGRTIFR